jgi:murein DD-endopeptidase MepM/ murein hydrolase activator NlpD
MDAVRNWMCAVVLCSIAASGQFAWSADPPAKMPAAAPEKYVLNYPVAQQFCPPVESYFDDVAQSIQNINGHLIRHPLGGGYGLPVVIMVGGKNLLHLGADVSWKRPGVPVYAIANGVVRISMGPKPFSDRPGAVGDKKKSAENTDSATSGDAGKPSGKAAAPNMPLGNGWGNLLVIEHQYGNGLYATSIYGHLAKRLVSVGDIVQAGQVIGAVGKKGIENGGYEPHLHFAVREGRMWEPGAVLANLNANGKSASFKLVDLREDDIEITVDLEGAALNSLTITADGQNYSVSTRNGKHYLPSTVLNFLPRADFPIVGYGLTTDGFREPTEFLREMRADTQPAAFGKTPKGIAAKPRD